MAASSHSAAATSGGWSLLTLHHLLSLQERPRPPLYLQIGGSTVSSPAEAAKGAESVETAQSLATTKRLPSRFLWHGSSVAAAPLLTIAASGGGLNWLQHSLQPLRERLLLHFVWPSSQWQVVCVGVFLDSPLLVATAEREANVALPPGCKKSVAVASIGEGGKERCGSKWGLGCYRWDLDLRWVEV